MNYNSLTHWDTNFINFLNPTLTGCIDGCGEFATTAPGGLTATIKHTVNIQVQAQFVYSAL